MKSSLAEIIDCTIDDYFESMVLEQYRLMGLRRPGKKRLKAEAKKLERKVKKIARKWEREEADLEESA